MYFFLDNVRPYYYNLNMAHLHKKMKKGRPYYYIREIARVAGKPKVINQVYLGSPKRMLEMATSSGEPCVKVQVQEFGALWLANLIEQEVGFSQIVDSVIDRGEKENGPTVGEYFLYAVFNRMIDARSKRALPEWYKSTAIQHIRPTQIDVLDSQHYWRKWERIEQKQLHEIAENFFQKLTKLESPSSDCFMFDTTNYYTYMASNTKSDLAKRGKNKAGRNWLRQIGVALLVSRDNQIPFYYREYEGNRHDSKLFARVMDQVIGAMHKHAGKQGNLTIVFDKGMNSEDNIKAIDIQEDIHFITTYSSYFAKNLVQIKLKKFQPVDIDKNRELSELGREDDRMLAWRTTGEYWGKERAVIVTYNPLTATRQRYSFEKKILSLQKTLFEMQNNIRKQKPHWRDKKLVIARHKKVCSKLHIPKDLYKIGVYLKDDRLHMNFRKNHYRIGKYINRFGKNILITDNMDWTTDEIVKASLDRYVVEEAFRQSKDEDLISLMPLRHWTDSKIRCHILTCIVALAYLQIIENRLKKAGLKITAHTSMDKMHTLHSCLMWHSQKRKPQRMIEESDQIQSRIIEAFGFQVKRGVLQNIKG